MLDSSDVCVIITAIEAAFIFLNCGNGSARLGVWVLGGGISTGDVALEEGRGGRADWWMPLAAGAIGMPVGQCLGSGHHSKPG